MVSLNAITTSNATLLNAPKPLTAVFVGATSGIGLATLKAFALSHALPKAYIIGRSASQFQTHLDEIQHSNPKGKFSFIEAEVSLMREVDRVCENIKKKEESFDALWLSCGVLKFGERDGMSNPCQFAAMRCDGTEKSCMEEISANQYQ